MTIDNLILYGVVLAAAGVLVYLDLVALGKVDGAKLPGDRRRKWYLFLLGVLHLSWVVMLLSASGYI